MRTAFVVGARPNYMKVAPILRELGGRSESSIEPLLVHTGQHYDAAMSDAFFRDLGMPYPDATLGVGSDTHAKQTAKVMAAFDEACDRLAPECIVVVGDVNSTIACALVASKRGIAVVHVEAGLRSYDRTMPEEINRLLTDQISDLLLITSEDARMNLQQEGVDDAKIRFVGNPMIDSLEIARREIENGSRPQHRYGVVTLHRPSNVDAATALAPILEGLRRAGKRLPLYFPVHPRTAVALRESGLRFEAIESTDDIPEAPGVYAMPPLGYVDFMRLLRWSAVVLTDSGGVQEEATVFGGPCATLRRNTERPVTVRLGTNELIPRTAEGIADAVDRVLAGIWKKGTIPPLWDGRAAKRIVNALEELRGE